MSAASHDAPSAHGVPRLTALDELPLSAEDCALGEVVADKYLIEGVIGRGSMGVVVRATHLGFDELVALKFIRPEMRKVAGIVSRFAREAKASVRIRNEHAVNVLDVGVADPIGPFFVMEYLEGINLEELVDSQGAFDSATAVKYVLETCEALAAAHAQGIVHRDIKPQNLFLAWQGRLELIKVLDFGISKAALRGQVFGDDLSSNENDWLMGTPLYMSPEQLRNAPDVDERTDIWALGAVLYELLCGQPLFSGDTQTQICRQVLEVSERPVRLPIPGVSEELWDVIERCLSLDKEERYLNVAELGEALLPFAPAGAVLHVERARALLGLRPLDLFEPDDEIEDIDVDPIDEPEPVAPLASVVQRPPPGRSWVEIAVPALACAVLWLGVRQCQLDERTAALSAPQTQTLALRPEPTPPEQSAARAAAPPAVDAHSSNAQATVTPGPCPAAPSAPPAAAAPSAPPPVAAAPSAPPPAAPSAPTPSHAPSAAAPSAAAPAPSAATATTSTPAPVAAAPAARAAAPTAATPPAATPNAGVAAPNASPASTPTISDVFPEAASHDEASPQPEQHADAVPHVEPKLEFRLIQDAPRAASGLAPNPERASTAPAPPTPR